LLHRLVALLPQHLVAFTPLHLSFKNHDHKANPAHIVFRTYLIQSISGIMIFTAGFSKELHLIGVVLFFIHYPIIRAIRPFREIRGTSALIHTIRNTP
jgi:hypothetical protein